MRLGLPKANPPKLHHRQAVDLAHPLARGLDANGVAADLFLQAPIDPVAPALLRVDRRLQFGGADNCLVGGAREIIRLLQEIDEAAHLGGKLLGIAAQARNVLDRARDAAAIERPQLFAPNRGGDDPRIERGRLRRAVNRVVEIGGDLE